MDVQKLVEMPPGWQGLLGALDGARCPLLAAHKWLQEERGSGYGENGNWSQLVDALCEEYPVSNGPQLTFIPAFLHFPFHLQRYLVAFIHDCCAKIPLCVLKQFSMMLGKHATSDISILLLCKLLEEYITANSSAVSTVQPSQLKQSSYRFTREICRLARQISQQFVDGSHKETHITDSMTSEPSQSKQSEDASSQPIVVDVDTPEKVPSQVGEGEEKSTIIEGLLEPSSCKQRKLQCDTAITDSPKLGPNHSSSDELTTHGIDPAVWGQGMKLKEAWENGGSEVVTNMPKEVQIFIQCSSEQMEKLCTFMELDKMSEAAVVTACEHLASVSKELSHSNCVHFARACLLPKISGLNQHASRMLQTAIVQFGQQYPRQISEGVLIPCATASNTDNCQADLICHVLKEACSTEHRHTFFRQFLDGGSLWTESTVMIVQLLLDLKTTLDTSLLNNLITALDQNCVELAGSLKFGKCILAVINKYGKQLTRSNIGGLQQVLECHKTFLKKSALAALGRLKV